MAYGQRGPSPMHTPPPGSRLSAYARRLEEIGGNVPGWESDHPYIRELSARDLLAETPLHDVPFPVVREFFVVPRLVAQGMPDGPRSDWLEYLVDVETEAWIDASRRQAKERARLPSKNKGGHPKPKTELIAIVMAAYFDVIRSASPGSRDNAHFEQVVRRLGPGIGRGTVRRVVKRERLNLRRLDEPLRDLVMLACLHIGDIMGEYDELHPPKNGHVPKRTPFGASYRARQAGRIGAPTLGDRDACSIETDRTLAPVRLPDADRSG